ncbi:TorD/DmsD family molecular chaperone [Neoactinobaculum massilliense]|uniref:TorD/DmsD family molecular chaperone n=1 Tax=Neoactinobaculum massilliense TaxID=2364794 RepID=UPI000F520361|nr:molecular chaperone TorD family protein [Neoactinobaculum massilliense]
MTFNPFSDPAPADFAGRGIRLTTAAAVLSRLFAASPERGLMENLTDTALLRLWPLRDNESVAGADAMAAMENSIFEIRDDYVALFGFQGTVSLSGADTPGVSPAAVFQLTALYRDADYQPEASGPLAPDHMASELGFLGFLASRITAMCREGAGPDPSVNRTAAPANKRAGCAAVALGSVGVRCLDFAGPLMDRVVDGVAAHARTDFYRAAGRMLAGFSTQARRFFADVAGSAAFTGADTRG